MATKFSEITAAEMRSAMVDSQLRTNDVIDPAVIGAMGAVPREAHVPAALARQLADGGRLVAARREGAVTRLVEGVSVGGTVALRSFADMDVAPLPGFAAPAGFRF